MKIVFIRHGKTLGNSEARYVGRTDESLSEEGKKELNQLKNLDLYPTVDKVFASPMKRCIESAHILFPLHQIIQVTGLQECDFGDFEYKNYKELNGNSDYQAWIDSGGIIGFPNGESQAKFCQRILSAFDQMIAQFGKEDKSIAVVAHGGTVMAILDAYSYPHKDYFEWQLKNGCGYQCDLDLKAWKNGKKFLKQIVEVKE